MTADACLVWAYFSYFYAYYYTIICFEFYYVDIILDTFLKYYLDIMLYTL